MSGFDVGRVRDLAANGIRVARRIGAARVVMALPPVPAKHADRTLQLAIEGALLGSYRFNKYRTDDSRRNDAVKTVLLTFERGRGAASGKKRGKQTASHARELNASIDRARIVAEAVCHRATSSTSRPRHDGSHADEARQVGNARLTVTCGPKECEKLGWDVPPSDRARSKPRFIPYYTPPRGPSAASPSSAGLHLRSAATRSRSQAWRT